MTERDKPGSAQVEGPHAPGAPAGDRRAAEPAILPADQAAASADDQDLLPLAIPESGRRVRGRPVNSPNIRTNTTFLAAVSRYGDPLIAEIAWGNMDTLTLIRELRKIASDAGLKLGATVMDVVRFQQQCRASALPFGHAKRAAVDDAGVPVLPTFLGIGRVEVQQGGKVVFEGRSIEDQVEAETIKEVQQIQEDSDAAPEVSHADKSHDDAKP